jgi:hypothetical protein
MVGLNSLRLDERFLATGDEAGTAPDDRRFRPDVEGLRAVAVLLVVFYHANVARVTGGFVGVDVFFVISGFVITGLLLREHRGTGRTSILNFYARRVRRILPAATLVILVVVRAILFHCESVGKRNAGPSEGHTFPKDKEGHFGQYPSAAQGWASLFGSPHTGCAGMFGATRGRRFTVYPS